MSSLQCNHNVLVSAVISEGLRKARWKVLKQFCRYKPKFAGTTGSTTTWYSALWNTEVELR